MGSPVVGWFVNSWGYFLGLHPIKTNKKHHITVLVLYTNQDQSGVLKFFVKMAAHWYLLGVKHSLSHTQIGVSYGGLHDLWFLLTIILLHAIFIARGAHVVEKSYTIFMVLNCLWLRLLRVLKHVSKAHDTFFVLYTTLQASCRTVLFTWNNSCPALVVRVSHETKLYDVNWPLGV